MWGANRRIRRLEVELALTAIGRAEVARQATLADTIVPVREPGPAVPSVPMPVKLVAAAHDGRDEDFSLHLELNGASVVAVISGEGDPRQWWTAIWQLAGPEASAPPEASVQFEMLPAGLNAVAVRWASDAVILTISATLEPDQQRAAAILALETRPAGDDLPAQFGLFSSRAPVKIAATIGAVVLVAAVAALVLTLARPHQGQAVGLSVPGRTPAHARSHSSRQSRPGAPDPAASGQPATGRAAGPPGARHQKGHQPKPTSSASARPTHSARPSPTPSSSTSSSPAPSPQPSSTTSSAPAPSPDPTPTPTPTPTSSGKCITVLGVKVCL